MQVSVIQIGNSKGIRIPKSILQQLHIEDKLELEISGKGILLKPLPKKPREHWRKAFQNMHANGEDKLLVDYLEEDRETEWTW